MINFWSCILLFSLFITTVKGKSYEKVDILFYNSKSGLNSSYFAGKMSLFDKLIESVNGGQLEIYGENKNLISKKIFFDNFTYYVPEGTVFEEDCCFGCVGSHQYPRESLGIAIHTIGTFQKEEAIKWISIVIPSVFFEKSDSSYSLYKNKPYKILGSFKYNDVKRLLRLNKTFWINADNMAIKLPMIEALEKEMFISNQLIVKSKTDFIFNGLSTTEVDTSEINKKSVLNYGKDKGKPIPNLIIKYIQNFNNQIVKKEIQEKGFEYIFKLESKFGFNEPGLDTLLRLQTVKNSISDTLLQHFNGLKYLLEIISARNEIDSGQTFFPKKIDGRKSSLIQMFTKTKNELVAIYPELGQRIIESDFIEAISTMNIYLIEEFQYENNKPIKRNIEGIKLYLSANIEPRGFERLLFYLPRAKIDTLLLNNIEKNQIIITKNDQTNYLKNSVTCSEVYVNDIWDNELYGFCEFTQNVRTERIKRALIEVLEYKRF